MFTNSDASTAGFYSILGWRGVMLEKGDHGKTRQNPSGQEWALMGQRGEVSLNDIWPLVAVDGERKLSEGIMTRR
jgi:hypothetical protein